MTRKALLFSGLGSCDKFVGDLSEWTGTKFGIDPTTAQGSESFASFHLELPYAASKVSNLPLWSNSAQNRRSRFAVRTAPSR